ncbi:putative capsid protein [Fiddler Crab associated circular virus]|uniref:putative capsid protein n=1 Tax=Fiddler Crab associated circular virus TaxID=1692249 RepID=UPI0006A6E446|nr:putative capsid protein [Fiddler Crab associated circular virus]AKV62282.1 putative capsid protein [Fiddler Crab associated circular virus]
MPYARKTQKSRKRTYRRKTYRRKNLVLSKAPIPNTFSTKLRYSESVSVNPGASGVAGVYVMNASSCYDPNTTGTGHQPRGFDQWMTMYDHFTVIGAKITAQFSITGQADDRALICGIALKDANGVYADKNDYMEGRNVVSKLVSGGATGDARTVTLSKTYSAKKFLGISKPLASSLIRGTSSANPSENAYFHLFAAPTGNADLDNIPIQVLIDYLVVFTEPQQPSQS